MPRDGANILSEVRVPVLTVFCEPCGRRERYDDERGYHGTDWVPHDAKMREAGAPGARTRIETLALLGREPELVPDQSLMDGINAGRKTIPFARFDKKRCEWRSNSPHL